MSPNEVFNTTRGTVQLYVNGQSKGSVNANGQTVGEFVNAQAMRYGLKSFSVYVDDVKFYTENAGQSLAGVNKVEIVAKDSRGGPTWGAIPDEDWTFVPRQTPTLQPKQGATKVKLNFKRDELIASIQKSIDATEAKNKEAQDKFDAGLASAKAFVEANAETVAKNFGFKSTASFNEGESKDITVREVAKALGFNTIKPVPQSTATRRAQVALLSLASDPTVEVEEGHQFLNHLA